MFGDQAHSKRRSSPSYGFGSSTRNQAGKVFLSTDHAKLSTPGFSPGPTVYTLHTSLGTQADGRKLSSPQWAFGSSDRFSYEKKGMQIPGALHPTESFALHWSHGQQHVHVNGHVTCDMSMSMLYMWALIMHSISTASLMPSKVRRLRCCPPPLAHR